MFTRNDLINLLNAQPFVAFKLILSDDGSVEVRSRELVMVGRQCAVIGLLDPEAKDTFFDRWTTVWYLHVTRAEQLARGAPPFVPPSAASGSPSPVPS